MMRRVLFVTTALIAVAAAAEAWAQPIQVPSAPASSASTQTAEVGEVVVVARRRQERLRDVPVAASVVDADMLAARGGVTDPEKLLAGIPGVRYVNTSSPTTAETSVRASGTSRGTFAESAIGLYRDGVYVGGGLLGGRNYTRLDLFDIQRAEVLRGTQSALYGRNAVGGAINIISQKPDLTHASGYADVKYGVNNEQLQTQLVINQPLTDKIAVRLGAQFYDQDGGFYYNLSRNEYFDQEKGSAFRGQIRYTDGRLDANLLLEHQAATLPALNWQTVIAPSAAFPKGFVEQKRDYHWNSPSTAKQQLNAAVGTINYRFDWADLVSTTAARVRLTKNSFDSDAVDPPTLALIRATGGGLTVDANTAQNSQDRVESLYQDLHLSGRKVGGFDWLAGLELLKINDSYNQGNTKTPTLASPTPGTRQPAHQDIQSQALYGTGSYDLLPRLNLGVELRYAHDEKKFYTERFDILTGLSSGTRFKIDDTHSSNNLSYNLTASFHPVPNWLTYAKVGTAYRTGGFNRDLGDPRAPNPVVPGYDDESSFTYEVGAKGNLLRNVYAEMAAYRTTTDDLLLQLDNGCAVNVVACPVAATSFIINAGTGRSWGVEFYVYSRFNIGGGELQANAGGSRQHGDIVSGPFAGKDLPQVPDWVASATLNYKHAFIRGSTISGNLVYRAQWGGIQEITGIPQLSDYQTGDVRVAVSRGRWEAAIYANNADNNIYVNFGSATVKRWSQPRVYGTQLSYRW